MKRFVITEEEKKSIMGMYLLEQQPTGTTVSQTGSTVNRQMNRPPCIGGGLTSLGCWLDEIDKVQREIGNPKTWTMDSYNRLQKTLYDYKNWRETTPEVQAVQDSHNQKDEYVVQLPDHLKTVNESVGTKSFIRLTESDLSRIIKKIINETKKNDDEHYIKVKKWMGKTNVKLFSRLEPKDVNGVVTFTIDRMEDNGQSRSVNDFRLIYSGRETAKETKNGHMLQISDLEQDRLLNKYFGGTISRGNK